MPHRDVDRRQVTVLFADLSGFTSLAERLDPEEVRAFQNALFEALGQAISRYDGFDGVDAPQRPWCAKVEVLKSTT
jgi:class 3 adenylate cyclase